MASVEWENDVPCSDNLMKTFGEHYRTVRNTLRFLLGNLYDFDPSLPEGKVLDLDRWAMEQVDLLVADPSKARRVLGWSPKVTFEQLVAMMVEADLARHRSDVR